MITIHETRTLTLYLVDQDGMPVRAATEDDLTRCSIRLASRVDSLKAAVCKVAGERDQVKRALDQRHEEMSLATGIRYEADYISAPGPWDEIAKEAEENRKATCELQEWKCRAEQLDYKREKLLRELDIVSGDRATFANCIDAIAKSIGVDSCALLEDPSITVAKKMQSLRDESDSYYTQLTEAARAAGAPDASTLVARIEELRREAAASELQRGELTAIHAALNGADVPECLPGKVLSGAERIAMLASELRMKLGLHNEAMIRESHARKSVAGCKADRDKWASMYHNANNRLAAIGEAMGFEDPEGLEDAVRALKSRLAELESRPLSPEVARVIEAAKAWVGADGDSDAEDDAEADIYHSLSAIPSHLPVVVTCGECERADAHCNWKEAGARFCGLGKRRQS